MGIAHGSFRERKMKSERTLTLALLLTVCAMGVASPAAGQRTSTPAAIVIHLDARTGAKLAARSDGRIGVADFLRATGTVELRSARQMELTVHVFRMRGGAVLDSYRSRPVTIPPGERLSMDRFLEPGAPSYGDFILNPEYVVEATKTVPAGVAIEDPGRFVINGVIPYHPKGWESMEAFFAVAVPTDGRQAEAATSGFAGVYAPPER